MVEMVDQEDTPVEEVQVAGSDETTPDAASEGWMDILGSGDLKKRIMKAGVAETRAKRGDTVKVSLLGRMEDDVVVDEQEELVFSIGDGEVIQGLDLVVPLMDKGEVAEVFMSSRFAYGGKGLNDEIPPDANLTYIIRLIDFKVEDDPLDLSLQERKIIGNRKRERGNWWYNREEFAQAIQCYKAAVDFLDDNSPYGTETTPEMKDILDDRLKAYNNMAAAQIKLQAYDVALKSVDVVLMCQANNVKALYRKGKILGHLGKITEGVKILKTALALDPTSMVIHQELSKLSTQARKDAQAEKSLYSRMLGLKPTKEIIVDDHSHHTTLKMRPYKIMLASFLSICCILVCYQYHHTIGKTFGLM